MSAGTPTRKWTWALGKSSDQNSSQYWVLRPHWLDLKANVLKQNCASAYASTCQAHIRCTASLSLIGAPENGVIRIRHWDLRKHISFQEIWCKLAIARPHMLWKHVLPLKCHHLISELSIFGLECSDRRLLRPKARASNCYNWLITDTNWRHWGGYFSLLIASNRAVACWCN